MKFSVFAFSFAALAATAAFAQDSAPDDPIEARQNLMEERSDQMRVLVPMAQEKAPFDAAAAMEALEVLHENAMAGQDIDALWPEGSEGGDSLPAVWSDREGFQAAADDFAADAAAAVEAAPQDVEAFKAVFGPLAANCGACHESFRDPDED